MTSQELKKTLWAAADKLRGQMDAAEYKHIVLGLIFVKYVSDAFDERRRELAVMLADPTSDHHFSDDPEDQAAALEYRTTTTRPTCSGCHQAPGGRGSAIRPSSPTLATLWTRRWWPSRRRILGSRTSWTSVCPNPVPAWAQGELIDLVSTIGFTEQDKAKDVLGEVYEYFLGQFATAEGKKGGQFYTPRSVVRLIVVILAPHEGRVNDPCCGSGCMFVQSEKFVQAHGGRVDDISIYGQESNATTWRLAAMNLALRGMGFNLGKEPLDTFGSDQHPDLKADYVLAKAGTTHLDQSTAEACAKHLKEFIEKPKK
jgi:type I restriction enzyme M protein